MSKRDQQEDDSVAQEGLMHLQGYDPVVQMANVKQRRGPRNPPDLSATREHRALVPAPLQGVREIWTQGVAVQIPGNVFVLYQVDGNKDRG